MNRGEATLAAGQPRPMVGYRPAVYRIELGRMLNKGSEVLSWSSLGKFTVGLIDITVVSQALAFRRMK